MPGMNKPSYVNPNRPLTSGPQFPMFLPDPSIQGNAGDDLIKARGVRMWHQRVLPCPNMSTVNDDDHDPDCPVCDNSGYIAYGGKEIYGAFSPNNVDRQPDAQGNWENSRISIVFPAVYDDGEEADFMVTDRLTMLDFETRQYALVPYKNKNLKLRYPILKIDSIISVVNGSIKNYLVDIDFMVTNGEVVFNTGREPYYDLEQRMGEVLTVSYYTKPIYVVEAVMVELRITQELLNTGKICRRLPQEVRVVKDWIP